MPLTYEKIRNEIAASKTIFIRGENLYSLGNYKLVDEADGKYQYGFDGNYGEYRVSVSINGDSIITVCSCPYPLPGCKHTVTALLDLLQETNVRLKASLKTPKIHSLRKK